MTTSFFPLRPTDLEPPEVIQLPVPDMERVKQVRPGLGGYDPGQIVRALRSEGLPSWSAALNIYGNADDAFLVTAGRRLTRDEKVQFYSTYFGERPKRIADNLEQFESSGAIFADPHGMREDRAKADALVAQLDARYAGKTPEQMRADLLRSFEQDPDETRKIMTYAAILQRPPAWVAANLETVEKELLIQAMMKELDGAQRTREFYENPVNLGTMRDQVSALAQLEGALVSRHGGFMDYLGVNLKGQLRDFARSVLGVSKAGKELTNAVAGIVGAEVYDEPYMRVMNALLRDVQDGTRRLTDEAGSGKTWSDVLGGITQMGTYIASAAVTGQPWLPLAAVASQESGNVYADLREEGASLLGAFIPALTVGIINTLLEEAQIGGIQKMLGIRNKLQTFAYDHAGQLVREVFTQGLQEVAQGLVSDAGTFAGELMTPRGATETFFERLDRSMQEGLYEGAIAGVGALFFATLSAPGIVRRGRQLAAQRASVARLALAQTTVSKMADAGVDPTLVLKAGQQILEGTPGEYSSLPAKEVAKFFQEAPDLRGDVLKKLGVTEEEFEEAIKEGGSGVITFRTMNWLNNIGNTEAGPRLIKYLEVGEYLSAEAYEALVTELEERSKAVAETLADISTKEEPTPEELRALRKRLIEVGGYTAEQADAIVAAADRGLRVAAVRRGVSLTALAEKLKLGLWVEGTDPGDPQITSATTAAQDPVQAFNQLSKAVYAYAEKIGAATEETKQIWSILEELTKFDQEMKAAIQMQRSSSEELSELFKADPKAQSKWEAAVARVNEALGTTFEAFDAEGVLNEKTFAKLQEMRDAGVFRGEELKNVRNAIAGFLAGHARMNAFEINQVLGKRKDLAAAILALQARIDETFGATPIVEKEDGSVRIAREPIERRPRKLASGEELNTRPQFGGFGRTFAQTFIDYLPDQVFENFRQSLLRAVEAAYAQGKAQGSFPVPFMDKPVESVSESDFSTVGPIKVAEKTNVAFNLSSACPMFIIGAHGCYLDGCYVTGMGKGGNTINYYSRAAYTGEILQLAQEDIDLLNSVGGLRVNGMGDLTWRQFNQLKDAVRHAAMRGLKMKVITKQDATFEMFERMRQEGQDVSHVQIQPSLDPYWVPITEDDIVDSFANNYHLVETWRKRPTPEIAAQIIALYQEMGREALLIDDTLYRKYGYSVEKYEALRTKYPELNLVPRVVVGTPEEILYFAKNYPRFLQTWMHAAIRGGMYSIVHGRVLEQGEIGNFTSRIAIFQDEKGRWQIQAQAAVPKASNTMQIRKESYRLRKEIEKLAHKRKPTPEDAEKLVQLRAQVQALIQQLKDAEKAQTAGVSTEERALYTRVRDLIEKDENADFIFRRMAGALDNEPSAFCCTAGADKNACNDCTSHCHEGLPSQAKPAKAASLRALLKRIDATRRGMKQQLAVFHQPPPGETATPRPRGATEFFADGSVLIRLFTGADKSTLIHELGHIFFQLMEEDVLAGVADAQTQADFAALAAARDQHGIEGVMRMWEAYFFEGKAPTPELAWPFVLFARWMTRVYATVKRLLAPLGLEKINPEIREAFDRWLATEDERNLAEDAYRATDSLSALVVRDTKGPEPKEPKAPGEGEGPVAAPEAPPGALTPAQVNQLQRLAERLTKARKTLQRARDKALAAEVQRRLAAQLRELGGVKALRAEVQAEVEKRPVYAAARRLKGWVVTTQHADGSFTQTTKHGIAPELLLSMTWESQDAAVADGLTTGASWEPPGDVADALRAKHGAAVLGPGLETESELNQFARDLGFANGRQMIQALLAAPAIKDAVRDEMDRRRQDLAAAIRNELGPGVPPGTTMVHIDEVLDYLVADLALAEERLGRAKDRRMTKAVAEVMRARIREHLQEDHALRRARSLAFFSRAEARAAGRAFALAKKGKLEEALDARREQIYYHIAVMEALKIRERAAVMTRWARRAKWDKVEESWRNLALDILTTYRLVDAPPPEWAKADQLAWPNEGWVGEDNGTAESKEDEGLRSLLPTCRTMIPTWVQAKHLPAGQVTKKNPQGAYSAPEDLTFAQLEALYETLQWIKSMGTKELRALRTEKIRTIKELAAASIARLKGMPKAKVHDIRTWWGRKLELGERAFAALKVMEFLFEQADGSPVLAGEELGPLHGIFNRISDAQSSWQARWDQLLEGDAAKARPSLKAALQTLAEAQARLEAELGRFFEIAGVPIPEILTKRKGFKQWSVDQVLAVLFNRGNDANMHRLMHSDLKLTQEQIDTLSSLLKDSEWDAIQQVWDVLDSLYPEMAEVSYRLTNSRPPKEPAVPFIVRTADGKVKQLRGGYYPLYSDPMLSLRGAVQDEAKVAMDDARKNAIYNRNRMNTGFKEKRARDKNGKPLATQPVLLTTATLMTHLKDVTLFIHMAEAIQEFHWLTRDEEWADAFREVFGEAYYKELRQWLNYQARPERRSTDEWSGLAEWLRTRFISNVLGLKLFVSLKQREGYGTALNHMAAGGVGRLKALRYLGIGMRDIGFKANLAGQPVKKILDEVHRLSKYMPIRESAIDRDVRDFVNTMRHADLVTLATAFNKRLKKAPLTAAQLQDIVFWMIKTQDMAVVYPVWWGSYNLALDENLNGITETMSMEDREVKAAEYADVAVRMSQSSAMPVDQARVQRLEGPWRLMACFMTEKIKRWNRTLWYVRDPNLPWGEKVAHFAIERLLPYWVFMVGPLLLYGDDDRPQWYDFMLRPSFEMLAAIPFVNEGLAYMQYGKQNLPAFDVFKRPQQGLAALKKGDMGRTMLNLWQTFEWFWGVPVSNIPVDLVKVAGRMES